MLLAIAILLFLIAAIFGLSILMAILKDQPTPKVSVFIHGPLAATGLILVLIYLFTGTADPLLVTSVILFVLAALGGLTLFTLDMKNKPLPKLLALLHPLFAVTALVLLLVYLVR